MESAVERLSGSEITAVKRLLADHGLPADDCEQPANQFFGIYEQQRLIACGGLQVVGAAALLRSVVVIESHQGRRLGSKLISYLLKHASQLGLSEIYLLTETAADYFKALGFQAVERSAVPSDVAATEQFKSLCPASADCLMKILENGNAGDQQCR